MDAKKLWVVVRDYDGKPCPPMDDNNEGDGDVCMMVFRTVVGCEAACGYQSDMYGIACHHVRLSELE